MVYEQGFKSAQGLKDFDPLVRNLCSLRAPHSLLNIASISIAGSRAVTPKFRHPNSSSCSILLLSVHLSDRTSDLQDKVLRKALRCLHHQDKPERKSAELLCQQPTAQNQTGRSQSDLQDLDQAICARMSKQTRSTKSPL